MTKCVVHFSVTFSKIESQIMYVGTLQPPPKYVLVPKMEDNSGPIFGMLCVV